MTKKHYKIISIALLINLCLIFLIYKVWQTKTYYHFKPVVAHQVYRSGTLSATGLKLVYQRTHFKTDIIVRSQKEITKNEDSWFTREKAFCQRHHIKLVIIPLPQDIVPSKKEVSKLLALTTNKKDQPVLIHCAQGVIRTGMMVAAYRVKVLHENKAEVLATLPMFGHNMTKHPEMKIFISQL